MKNKVFRRFICHSILCLVAIFIFLANMTHSGLWYPDAPSHALNGVFYKDMIEEVGFLHPVSYAERYYVQYPSLTVASYPPVFYVIEALLFEMFGVSSLTAKFGILLFSLLGVNLFFVLLRLWFPVSLSLIGSVLFLLQPAVLFAQKNVMLEMPALAICILAVYCLYTGTERHSSGALFWAPVFMALAFLTKQNTVFLLLVAVIWIAVARGWSICRSRYLIAGLLSGAVFLAPWVIINLSISRFYVVAVAFEEWHPWTNLLYYIRIAPEIIGYPVIFMVILSLILAGSLIKEDSYKLALIWAGCVCFFLLLFKWKEPRQAVYLIPPLIIMCLWGISLLRERVVPFSRHKGAYIALLIAVIALNADLEGVIGGREIRGFEQVADFVTKDRDCMAVLYDGYFNSNFIFNMRARDRERRVYVFRASKLVYSTKWLMEMGYHELIDDISSFYKTLDRYSIKYIVQEEKDSIGTQANKSLRKWVKDGEFRLVKLCPIQSEGMDDLGSFLIYEFVKYEAKPIREIELDMPAMGRKISVRLDRDQ